MSNQAVPGQALPRRYLSGLVAGLALVTGLLVTDTRPASADQPYGPYTCKAGFVWRDAVAGDQVCVTSEARQAAADENALAPSRRSPNGGPWGPDTCLSGFVWREARPSDHACVPTASRDRVAGEDGYPAVSNLVDPAGTPRDGLILSVQRNQFGDSLYVTGGGMSPNGSLYFYALGNYWQSTYALGFLNTDSNGNVPDDSYIGDVGCGTTMLQATVIVDDRRSGMVTNVGTFAMSC
jgi:hypothetical protein